MSNGALTGLVIHVGSEASCVAPVVLMKLLPQALFRLPLGWQDLELPEKMEFLFKVRKEK